MFARAEELLALGLSVPQVTKIFLKLREMGLDLPTDVVYRALCSQDPAGSKRPGVMQARAWCCPAALPLPARKEAAPNVEISPSDSTSPARAWCIGLIPGSSW